MNNKAILKQRGIDNAYSYSWQDANMGHRSGWKYPLIDPLSGDIVDWIWKNADSNDKGWKYRPYNGLLSDHYGATWYIANLEETIKAIQANGGQVYVANGAPSLLAYKAAGIKHVISGRHEVSPPTKLIYVLQKWNVANVTYIVDNDETGFNAAIKWRNALRGSGIDFEAYNWQTNTDKYDANDAWIEAQFNPSQFSKLLEHARQCPVQLPLPQPKPTYDFDASTSEDVQKLIDNVALALGIQHFKSNGWSRKNVSSPFRDDTHPSFDFNKNSGVGYDFGGGNSYSVWEIADQLGIPYERKAKKDPTIDKSNLDAIPEDNQVSDRKKGTDYGKPYDARLNLTQWQNGLSKTSWIDNDNLPIDWIRAIMTLTDARSAVPTVFIKLHQAFRNGELDPSCFDMKDIQRVVNGCDGNDRIKRLKSTDVAIKTLLEMGFVSDSGTYTTYIDKSDYPTQKSGRPSCTYSIEFDSNVISMLLVERLDRFVLEHHTSKTIAPRMWTMIQELRLNLMNGKTWDDLTSGLLDNHTSSMIRADMNFWHERLLYRAEKMPMLAIDYDELSNHWLRCQLFADFLNHHTTGIQLNEHEICRIIGTKSNSSLSNILEDIGATSIEQRVWHSVDYPKRDNFETIIFDAAKPQNGRRGGVALAINYKIYGGKWLKRLVYVNNGVAKDHYLKDRDMIDDMRVLVQLPSLYRYKTADELAQEQKAQIIQEDIAPETIETAQNSPNSSETDKKDTEPMQTPKKLKKRKTERYSPQQDRSWKEHDKEWLYHQIACQIYCMLNLALHRDMNLYTGNGELVQACDSYKDVILFMLSRVEALGIEKPFHMPHEYFDTEEGNRNYDVVNPPFAATVTIDDSVKHSLEAWEKMR